MCFSKINPKFTFSHRTKPLSPLQFSHSLQLARVWRLVTRMMSSNLMSRKRINLSIILTLLFGLISISTSHAEDISVSVDPTNPFRDFPVVSSGGVYLVDVAANSGDSFVQLYDVASAGTFISSSAPNPTSLINDDDDSGPGVSSRIIGTAISGPHVIRVTSFSYWAGQFAATETYTLSYTGFTTAAEPPPQAVIYYEPILVPYLVSTSTPQIHIKDEKLICSAGNYQAGLADRGNIPTDGKDAYKPSNFTYNIRVNGQPQRSLAINSGENSASWDLANVSSQAVATCSVAVTWNSLTVEDSSTANISGLKTAKSRESEEVIRANTEFSALLAQNFEKYQKTLVDNHVLWREQIASIRANYYGSLARATESNGATKAITAKSNPLKEMIAAQRQSAADFRASQPIALAAKDAANKDGLDAREAAIAIAHATYGAFIESIGYGVLIP